MAFDDGPIPPYFQLKTLLLDAVLSGEYRPGDRLPTEHELCRRYGISRTPVSRALSELAEEGVLVRQRRNGTFVNPHWLRRPSDRAEVRIVVPEGPWESMIRAAATSTAVGVSVVTVPRPTLHQFLTHAVAEGQAPDLALLDSVWLPEFAEAGFVHALEDVDERWIRDEYEVDFLAPLVAANRYRGRTYAVSAFADVVGLWYRREAVEARASERAAEDVGRATVDRAKPRRARHSPSRRHARWLEGRRDDVLLPDRTARVERRQRHRAPWRHARLPRHRAGAAVRPEPDRGRPHGGGRRGIRVEPLGTATRRR